MQRLPKWNRRRNGAAATHRKWISARLGLHLGTIWLCLSAAVSGLAAEAGPGGSNAVSIAELQRMVDERGQTILSFQLEGVVCAVVRERRMVALQDSSATALLEVPSLESGIELGDWLVITGRNCSLTRSRFGIQLGTAPVVNNDGHHPRLVKSGGVFLPQGLQPFRLSWFNGVSGSALKLDYEGPGLRRQKVPPTAFWRRPPGTTNQTELQRGLAFEAYLEDSWLALADFERLKPAATGVAADLDLKHRAREENTGLVFSGYLEIPSPGVYTFHLESDDGADLYVGDRAAGVEVVALKDKSVPAVRRLAEALVEPASPQWVEIEGQVVFAGHNESGLELEINARGERCRATVIKSSDSKFPDLLHRQIHAAGICRIARDAEQRKIAQVIVPGPDQIEIREPEKDSLAREASSGAVLTAAEQIRRLKPEEASKGLLVKITGVVIWTSPTALVIADSTGGVFTHWTPGDRDAQPRVGELWEIAGRTAPGDFSPVILSSTARFLGNAEMPEPIRPTWDQIMNGSLDAQYVEIRGVLTAVSESEMTLLTPDGKLKIRGNTDRPLTRLPGLAPGGAGKFQGEAADPSARRSLIDSVVRLRGCFTAEWDRKTKQVKAGVIYLGAAIIDLEEPPPRDPFSAAARKTADLLRFDARASALQRTKVAGQIIYARPREYYVQDEQTGLRFLTRESLPLRIGDLVEGVGFPQLGGPSPVLQEAQVRKTGSAALPRPVPVSAQDLLDRNLDSTLVRLEAVLVNDAADREERVLELQAGPCHFRARLKSERGSWKSLAPGSRLQLSGVYSSARGEPADENLDPFELLLTNASAITVLQQPPWWTARRAITVVALLAGGMGVSLVWITLLRRQVEERTAQLQKQIEERQAVEQRRIMEQERTRVAQDLHDELGAGLTEVGILGSLAKNPSVPAEERERYLDRLTEAARSLVTGLDEIVWAVNPHYDSVASLASYYSLFAQRFLNLAGIACRLEIAERFPEHPLDSSVRHGIFLAFKEALNNVVRHSEATEVGLRIAVAEDELTIAVKDNGRGLESAPQAPGNDGLAGMRERIAKLGGHCEINSHPGRGTTVEFRLPLPGAQSQTTKPAAPREGVRPA